ncbi:hypothetical protein BD414DRAFT_413540, partial [Trametes punicea]
AMAPEIRFNALGIPYLVEFANITFRSPPPSRSNSRASSRSLASRREPEAPQPSLRSLASPATASSETLAGPRGERELEPTEDSGLYIRFASQLSQPPSKLSASRIARLKYRIARAVMAAGMDTSPSAELGDPMDDNARSRVSISSIRSEDVETKGMPGSLFRGTYGQVMTALRAAGLVAVSCKESGVQEATRLGALFVARPNERGGVEFTKLTLWG